jgi:hypothetical protein
MRPTLELLGELAEQTRSLVQVELALIRAELSERGALVSSSLIKVGRASFFFRLGARFFWRRLAWRSGALAFPRTSGF